MSSEKAQGPQGLNNLTNDDGPVIERADNNKEWLFTPKAFPIRKEYDRIEDFCLACYNGNAILVESSYCTIIAGFCEDSKSDPFRKTMVEKQINLANRGLKNALDGGHVKIAKLMILKGATNLVDCMYDALNDGKIDFVIMLYNHGASTPYYMYKHLAFTEAFIIKLFENQMPRDCFSKMEIYHDSTINNVLVRMDKMQTQIHKLEILPFVLLQLVSIYSIV